MSMIQYNTNSGISTTYLNLFYSKLGPLDKYVIMSVGDGQYSMLVNRFPTDDCVRYDIVRTGSGYGSYNYELFEYDSDWDYVITNEIYVYSNIGYGSMSVLPVHQIMLCWGVTGLVCLVFLFVMFRGVLFKCRR